VVDMLYNNIVLKHSISFYVIVICDIRDEKWQIENNLVLKEGKIYVSSDEELRTEIIWLHHDIPVAGHEGW